MEATEKISNFRFLPEGEDQKRTSLCTLYAESEGVELLIKQYERDNDINLDEYKMGNEVSLAFGHPPDHIEKHGYWMMKSLQHYSTTPLPGTDIKIKDIEIIQTGNLEMMKLGMVNAIWKGKPLFMGFTGWVKKNENGDMEWYKREDGKKNYNHAMMTYEVCKKNGIWYGVARNSYHNHQEVYFKLDDMNEFIQNRAIISFDITLETKASNIIRRARKNREYGFSDLQKFGIIK